MQRATSQQKRVAKAEQSIAAHLKEMQHFAELGRISANLLHEISNPLTAAILELEQSVDQPMSIRQARHSLEVLRRYVEAARQQARYTGPAASFQVKTQLSQLKHVVIPLAKVAHIKLTINCEANYRLYGDPVKFQHILANLIVNAMDAYQNDLAPNLARPVVVNLRQAGLDLVVEVTDWGEGIPANNIGRIFEPFYTTKTGHGHGLGIGLYMVKQQMVNDFYGTIEVSSSRRQGTTFRLSLPLVTTKH